MGARSNNLYNLSGVNTPMLQVLDCANNDIRDLSGIGSFTTPSLRVLNLSNNDVADLNTLCNLAYLEAVCVSSNNIKSVNSVLSMINTCPNLRYLDLRNNDLPESSRMQLKETRQYRKPNTIQLFL